MTALITSYIYVFLKAAQQLNVVHHRYIWIIPVSYGMAACEVLLFGTIAVAAVEAHDKTMLIIQIGTGAGFGAMSSMFMHKWLRKVFDKADNGE